MKTTTTYFVAGMAVGIVGYHLYIAKKISGK